MTDEEVNVIATEIKELIESGETPSLYVLPDLEKEGWWDVCYCRNRTQILESCSSKSEVSVIAHMWEIRLGLETAEQKIRRWGEIAEESASRYFEALAALKALFSNPHICLSDQCYEVRDREMLGWDGPSVTAWGNAVQDATTLLKKHKLWDETCRS